MGPALLYMGTIQALFLAFFFFVKFRRHRILSDCIVSFFMLFLALPMITEVIKVEAEMQMIALPNALIAMESYPLTFGPFLYLYTRFETSKKAVFKKEYLLHFIPFILCFLILIFFTGMRLPPPPQHFPLGPSSENAFSRPYTSRDAP